MGQRYRSVAIHPGRSAGLPDRTSGDLPVRRADASCPARIPDPPRRPSPPGHGRTPALPPASHAIGAVLRQIDVPRFENMVFMLWPRNITAPIAINAMRPRIKAYSARPCPFSPRLDASSLR